MRLAGVSLIFSSSKRRNYEFAYEKSSGFNAIKNIPAWTKEEMMEAAPSDIESVEASFRIWGGNMRAYERFRVCSNMQHAEKNALAELDTQVKCFDAAFTKKMTQQLEKRASGSSIRRSSKKHLGMSLYQNQFASIPKRAIALKTFAGVSAPL
mmetsp:Transcript_26208/g.54716  ORF Transcript_26208/g.54716 Transcript_26208/m.54716 type:complete len:153 (-) Transcript_26208:920-1378(-)